MRHVILLLCNYSQCDYDLLISVLSAVRRDSTHVLRETLTQKVAADRTHQACLRHVGIQVKVVPHARRVVNVDRWSVIRRLSVHQKSVSVRRNREGRQRHERCHRRSILGGDARWLGVGDDEVQEVAQNGCCWAWRIRVDEEDGIFGL